MTVNTSMLRGRMVEKGYNPMSLSKRIGIDRSTFYRKMQDKGLSFTVGEMHKIIDVLCLTTEEAACIFLYKNSQ